MLRLRQFLRRLDPEARFHAAYWRATLAYWVDCAGFEPGTPPGIVVDWCEESGHEVWAQMIRHAQSEAAWFREYLGTS